MGVEKGRKAANGETDRRGRKGGIGADACLASRILSEVGGAKSRMDLGSWKLRQRQKLLKSRT